MGKQIKQDCVTGWESIVMPGKHHSYFPAQYLKERERKSNQHMAYWICSQQCVDAEVWLPVEKIVLILPPKICQPEKQKC